MVEDEPLVVSEVKPKEPSNSELTAIWLPMRSWSMRKPPRMTERPSRPKARPNQLSPKSGE